MAHESIFFSDCEGHRTLTEKHGTLHSPNYPCSYGSYSSYRGGQDCRWLIEPQVNSNSVKAIWIKFHTFYLDWPTNYCWLASCIYFQFRSPHLSVLYKPDDLPLRTEVIRSTSVWRTWMFFFPSTPLSLTGEPYPFSISRSSLLRSVCLSESNSVYS